MMLFFCSTKFMCNNVTRAAVYLQEKGSTLAFFFIISNLYARHFKVQAKRRIYWLHSGYTYFLSTHLIYAPKCSYSIFFIKIVPQDGYLSSFSSCCLVTRHLKNKKKWQNVRINSFYKIMNLRFFFLI